MIYQMQQTRSAALAPLSPKQRQKLAAMARFAYAEEGPDQAFDDWRHDQVRACVGKGGLTECCNEDYNPLKAHFLKLKGNLTGSLRATLKAATEDRRGAMWHLMKACTEARDVMPEAMKYVRGFVRNKRGISMDDADDKTIWHAVYTIRRKAQSLRKKKSGGESAGDVLGKLLGPISPKRRHVEGPF